MALKYMWRTVSLSLIHILLLFLVWPFGSILSHGLFLPRISKQQSFYEVINAHDQPPTWSDRVFVCPKWMTLLAARLLPAELPRLDKDVK
jgi:hypothetical protein